MPLKKIQPKPPSASKVPIPRYAEPYHQSPSQNNGIPYKKMKPSTPIQNNLPILHPSNNTSVFITSKPLISSHLVKPLPNLNPIYHQQLDRNGESDEQNIYEQRGDFDVTQFLSISLTSEEESKVNNNNKNLLSTSSSTSISTIENLKRKCNLLQQEIGKRDNTIRTMQFQMRDMRKKMDSISIQKILKDNFNGLTYEILESFLNNTNLDSYEKRYTDNIKDFAMKLFECSQEAYSMVREHFDLPHPSNVTHWLRASRDEDLDESGNNLSPQSSASGNYSGHENFESEDLNGFNIKIEPEDTYE